jgi:hypothetical protein
MTLRATDQGERISDEISKADVYHTIYPPQKNNSTIARQC